MTIQHRSHLGIVGGRRIGSLRLTPLLLAALVAACSASREPAVEAGADEPSARREVLEPSDPGASGFALLHFFGCATCHSVPMAGGGEWAGPRLVGTGDKLQADWLRRWLRDPAALRPGTLMPRLPLEEETRRVLEGFLLAQRASLLGEPAPAGDLARAEALFEDYDCLACHYRGGEGDSEGVPLDRTEERLRPAWLLAFLQRPDDLQPGTDMPDFDFTPEQSADLTALLLRGAPRRAQEQAEDAPPEGLDTFVASGCAGCHELGEPTGIELGPETGEAAVAFHRSPSQAGFQLPLTDAQVAAMASALADPEAAGEAITPELWEERIPMVARRVE